MTDKSIPLEIAKQLKDVPNPRRHKLVDNIVAACEALLAENKQITPPSVERKVKVLGLTGGPAAQTIYNNNDLKALVEAFSSILEKSELPAKATKAFSSDEEELLSVLGNARLKSMFRDIVYERDKLKQQMRILDANLKRLSAIGGMVDEQPHRVEKITGPMKNEEFEDACVELVQALDEYGFVLKGDDFVKGNRPVNAKKFVQILRSRSWIEDDN